MIILQLYLKLNMKHSMGKDSKTHKQMLQRLPKALAQIKTGSASENILNEISEIMYFYKATKVT